jgi:hypothetical protein
MTRSNWKENQREPEISILADLSVEVDDLFRPYLQSVAPPVQSSAAPIRPAPQSTSGQLFEVVIRSLTNFWPGSKSEALVPQRQATVHPTAPERNAPADCFTRMVMPKAITPGLLPLSHEVREELLELRAEVMQAARTQQLQTLMLCGVEGAVGTSFVAGQLTRLLAEFAQMKVAFLTLAPNREKKSRRALSPAASVLPRVQFLLRRTELPNLVELASANGTITLTELLCHCPTADVLRQMKAEFDLIVIDAPAITMYSEAAALAALMDGVILVAEPHVTPLRRMDRAHRRLRKAHAKVLGMVFNRQRRP